MTVLPADRISSSAIGSGPGDVAVAGEGNVGSGVVTMRKDATCRGTGTVVTMRHRAPLWPMWNYGYLEGVDGELFDRVCSGYWRSLKEEMAREWESSE